MGFGIAVAQFDDVYSRRQVADDVVEGKVAVTAAGNLTIVRAKDEQRVGVLLQDGNEVAATVRFVIEVADV